jgi:hypothetical protein
VVTVEKEIAREPTSGLFDVGGGLVQGERKTIELRCNLFGRGLLSLGGRVKRCVLGDIFGPAQ